MQPARIAKLLQPFLNPCHSESGRRPGEEPAVLSPAQLNYISTYIDILQRWNARINLTAVRDEDEIVTRHFGESLFAAQHLFPLRSTLPQHAVILTKRSPRLRRGLPRKDLCNPPAAPALPANP
jgi:rRNA small subunit methyltransferase G